MKRMIDPKRTFLTLTTPSPSRGEGRGGGEIQVPPFRLHTLVQSGFSLLEVLVTLVVMSLGVLGLAGLQSVALKNSHSALLRAQAAQYAYDMADRMRANRQQALNGAYNQAMTSATATLGTGSLADRDRVALLRQLRSLPQAEASIQVNDQGNATIVVRWDETAIGNTAVDAANCPEGSPAGRSCFTLQTLL